MLKVKTIFIEYYEYNIAFFAELLPTFPILAHCVNDISVTRVSNGNYLTSDISQVKKMNFHECEARVKISIFLRVKYHK